MNIHCTVPNKQLQVTRSWGALSGFVPERASQGWDWLRPQLTLEELILAEGDCKGLSLVAQWWCISPNYSVRHNNPIGIAPRVPRVPLASHTVEVSYSSERNCNLSSLKSLSHGLMFYNKLSAFHHVCPYVPWTAYLPIFVPNMTHMLLGVHPLVNPTN